MAEVLCLSCGEKLRCILNPLDISSRLAITTNYRATFVFYSVRAQTFFRSGISETIVWSPARLPWNPASFIPLKKRSTTQSQSDERSARDGRSGEDVGRRLYRCAEEQDALRVVVGGVHRTDVSRARARPPGRRRQPTATGEKKTGTTFGQN